MEDFDVLGLKSLFLFYTLLRVLRQGIGSFMSLAQIIIDLELITREFLSPMDLLRAQTLSVYEFTEVVVVGKYKHLMLRAL